MSWNEATDEYGFTTWTNEAGDIITAVDQGEDEKGKEMFLYDATNAEGVLAGVFVTREQAEHAIVAPESMEHLDIATMKYSERQAEGAA